MKYFYQVILGNQVIHHVITFLVQRVKGILLKKEKEEEEEEVVVVEEEEEKQLSSGPHQRGLWWAGPVM